jgi:hypothetical protein
VLKLARMIFPLNPLSYHSNLWGIKVRSKGKRRERELALECLRDVLAMSW